MTSKKLNNSLPIIVVGGGPSGMLAAITAAESSKNVIVYSKNPYPGKKISAVPSQDLFFSVKQPARKLAANFKGKSDFVAPIFKTFGYIDLIRLFKKMKFNVEPDEYGRFRANGTHGEGLIQALLDEAVKRGVVYRKSSRVSDVYLEKDEIAGVISNSSKIPASKVIIATGSFSSPKYGATKDGYIISEKLGHKVNEIKPALVDLITNGKYGKVVDGETFDDIVINIYFNNKLAYSETGEITFKLDAISGTTIINHSAEIIEKLPDTKVEIRLDFMPDQPKETMDTWLIKETIARKTVPLGAFLNRYFDENIIKLIQAESGIKLDKSVAHVTNLERKALARAIKDFRLTVKAPKPFNGTRGVIGGVSIDDIDPLTCESKKVKSLYFAGDVIDVLGPWGGYNMQFAFSSGYVAGKSAASNSK